MLVSTRSCHRCHRINPGVARYCGLCGARLSFLSRWSQARAERARRREVEQQAADERKLDELLDKVHRDGIQSLTPAERRFLEQASSKRR